MNSTVAITLQSTIVKQCQRTRTSAKFFLVIKRYCLLCDILVSLCKFHYFYLYRSFNMSILKVVNHKNYNFPLFSTNALAKLLSDRLLLDSLLLHSLLSDSSKSQSHSKLQITCVFMPVTLECLRLLYQYFNANFPLFSQLGYFSRKL